MVNTVKFSQFAQINLNTSTNTIVGVTALSGGTNFQGSYTARWTTGTRPSSPYAGLSGYNTTINMPEYWNGSAWVSVNGSGGGTVNSGLINQLAWYSANGTAVSGLATANNGVLVTSNSGVPSISSTLPSGLIIPNIHGAQAIYDLVTIYDVNGNVIQTFNPNASAVNYLNTSNQSTGLPPGISAQGADTNISIRLDAKGTGGTYIRGFTNGMNVIAGSVGEALDDQVLFADAISLTTVTPTNVASIVLGSGDWDIYGNVLLTPSVALTAIFAGISGTSATFSDSSLVSGITVAGLGQTGIVAPTIRALIPASTTLTFYLVCNSSFSSGTCTACGYMIARRRD